MSNVTVKKESNGMTGLEKAIFSVLQRKHSEISLYELLERLSQKGIDDEGAAKAEIARLLAEHKIKMTPRRQIILRSNGHRVRLLQANSSTL